MRAFDRDLIRGGHYGQRSCEPPLQAEPMAALTQACEREESPCQLGAVHTTWRGVQLEPVIGSKADMADYFGRLGFLLRHCFNNSRWRARRVELTHPAQ